ncbi:MAG: hypothetical protein FJZ57_01355 [Chlamydiae bacterium]|nr:hypothetical protein [Chlamydiota bacterium]
MINNLDFKNFYDLHSTQGSDTVFYLKRNGNLGLKCFSLQTFIGLDNEKNRNVWRIFEALAKKEFGEDRFNRILKNRNININQKISQGSPLTKGIIKSFLLGTSKVLLKDIQAPDDLEVKWFLPSQLKNMVDTLHKFPIIEDTFFFKINLESIINFLSYSKTEFQDIETHTLWKNLKGKNSYNYMEFLSKAIGLKKMEEGEVIPAPYTHGVDDYYYVFKKICTNGLVAYALKPVSSFSLARPLIVFRPTVLQPDSEDALYTVINDLNESLGEPGYMAAKDELSQLMRDPEFRREGVKIDIAGFSLGGNHAQRFFVDNYANVAHMYTVNAPSVERSLAENFASRINALPTTSQDAAFKISAMRVRDDLAHYVGQKHVGWGISNPRVKKECLQFDFVDRTQTEAEFSFGDRLNRHIQHFLNQPDVLFVAERHESSDFDMQVDNTGNSRAMFWESMRVNFGSRVVLPLLKVVNLVFLLCHKYLYISPVSYSEPRYKYPWMSEINS